MLCNRDIFQVDLDWHRRLLGTRSDFFDRKFFLRIGEISNSCQMLVFEVSVHVQVDH